MDETSLAKAILSGPDAIIAAGRDGVITFWNAGAERIFGFTEAHAVGRSLDLIIPERFRARTASVRNSRLRVGNLAPPILVVAGTGSAATRRGQRLSERVRNSSSALADWLPGSAR